ncbi:MAG: aconitase X [Candidatus Odinarchaeia archaeon]
MFLTREEERILNGERGLAFQKAMELIVSIGEIFGADKLLNINSSQISGISYKNIGDAGLSLIKDLKKDGGKINTFATLNPAGMDILDWGKMGIPPEFAKKQLEIVNTLKDMGATSTCTCTPYLIGNLPLRGEHISWAESSAVSFANSIIGAKTNREGGPVSLASAMLGKTPNYGLHIDENRLPTHRIIIETKITTPIEYSLLGYYIGRVIKDGIPFIEMPVTYNIENMKAICAAAASSGNIGMFYLKDVTPKCNGFSFDNVKEKIHVSKDELNEITEMFQPNKTPDIVTIGCPHATINEIKTVCELLDNKKVKDGCALWVCTSTQNKILAERLGYKEKIEKAGGFIAADTCMVVAPLEKMGFKCLATNSCKAAHYVPSTCKIPTVLTNIKNCINLITK